jgi:hypothetical protein
MKDYTAIRIRTKDYKKMKVICAKRGITLITLMGELLNKPVDKSVVFPPNWGKII